MTQAKSSSTGSIPIFKIAGVQVYLHWSWLIVAVVEMQVRTNSYSSHVWNIAEYLMLFAIVLLHEFGHVIACRQMGGRADRIMLWPLGGVAYVQPPPQPFAYFWSIAGGPLVNVLLLPFTVVALSMAAAHDFPQTQPDAYQFLSAVMLMNLSLLIFNMLPIYPLDGGQMLYAALWKLMGRFRSLQVVSAVSFAAAISAIGLAIWLQDFWIGVLAVFGAWASLMGFAQGSYLSRLAQVAARNGAVCRARSASLAAGQRVLGNFQQLGIWFAGTLRSISGEHFDVAYDDGDCEMATGDCVIAETLVSVDHLAVGDRVLVRWRGGARYFGGVVAELRPGEVHIHYDDGDTEWHNLPVVQVTEAGRTHEETGRAPAES